MRFYFNLSAMVVCCGMASVAFAQTAPAAQTPAQTPDGAQPAAAAPAPGPMPLPTPAITGPLSGLPPAMFDAGPFGKIAVNGIVSGYGYWQSNTVPGDTDHEATLSNGMAFIQKTDGWFQWYIQAGGYTMPALATPFLPTDKTMTNFYGPVPVGYVKLQAGKNTSFEIGSLPTLIGAEYTFSFENVNIERGLLWNQENAVTKGIQVNQTMGKFTASVSWNDFFYSNRYTAMSGSLAYTNGPHAISFVAAGNFGQTKFQTLATPVQNNGSIYNVIYTYTKGPWIIQPYYQHTSVPTNKSIGIVEGAATNGGAVLLSHAFAHGFSLAGRWEYISTTGGPNAVNLLAGPGSRGTSITVTPTFQYGGFFVRGDVSWVHAMDYTPGDVFGKAGSDQNQARAVAEFGFMFGNNLEKKP